MGEKIIMDIQADGMVSIEESDNEEAGTDIKEFEIIGIYENDKITTENEIKPLKIFM